MKKQAGFTLIELIMVIVILGVLSAFALPRFADLGGNARAASVQGAAGAIRSSANIVHAQFLAAGDSSATSVVLQGETIALVNGYPTVDSILVAAQISATDYDLAAAGTSPMTITPKGAATPATCQVTYVNAAANSAPVITFPATGC